MKGLDDKSVITFRALYGIIKYRIQLPKKSEKKRVEEERGISKIEGLLDKLGNIREVYGTVMTAKAWLKNKLHLNIFDLKVDFGMGDAYYSGVLSGVLWSVAGILISYLTTIFNSFEKKINIKTDFAEKKFYVELHCIFSIKIVYIIVVAMKYLAYKYRKRLKRKIKIKGGDLNV
jgi:hypothetical protein